MHVIQHRLNTIAQLQNASRQHGVEIDLRSQGEGIILHHDPFQVGDRFAEWLSHYDHGTLVLNVKEEGLEKKIEILLQEKGIGDYFFLDQSFPFLVKSFLQGQRRCAVRFSEFESIETVSRLAGKVDWVWVDCFNDYPLTKESEVLLHQMGFKLCLVSPELQGRPLPEAIHLTQAWLTKQGIVTDAVCTKRHDLWACYEN